MGRKKGRRKNQESAKNEDFKLSTCTKCGKQLRLTSMYSHMRVVHHMPNRTLKNKQNAAEGTYQEESEGLPLPENGLVHQRKRTAALQAQEILKIYTVKDISSNSKNNYKKPVIKDNENVSSDETDKDTRKMEKSKQIDEIKLVSCILCGKQLRPGSMYAHMRFIHEEKAKKPKLSSVNDVNLPRKKRYSAIQAMETIQDYILDNDQSSERENDREVFKYSSNENSDTDYYFSEENSNDIEDENIIQFLTKWKGKYKLCEKNLKTVATTKMIKEWTLELEKSKIITCRNEGCSKQFTSVLEMRYHMSHCQRAKLAECLLCQKGTQRSNKALLNHMRKYHMINGKRKFGNLEETQEKVAKCLSTDNNNYQEGNIPDIIQNEKTSNRKNGFCNSMGESKLFADLENSNIRPAAYSNDVTKIHEDVSNGGKNDPADTPNNLTKLVPCIVCGIPLHPGNIHSHMQFSHPAQNNKKEDPFVTNKELSSDDDDEYPKRKHSSVLWANDSTVNEDHHPELKNDKEYMESCEDSSDKESSDQDNHFADEKLEEEDIIKLLNKWNGNYYLAKKNLKTITKNMMKEWTQELEKSKILICKTKGCCKQFKSVLGMKYHISRCQRITNAACLICQKEIKRSNKNLLVHMRRYHMKSEENNTTTVTPVEKKSHCPKKTTLLRKNCNSENPFNIYLKYILAHESKSQLFIDWKPNISDWTLLSKSESEEYLPLQKESINFQFQVKDKPVTEWMRLQLFENSPYNADSLNKTFYVGGPVWASAWCPTPISIKARQYIALSCCKNSDKSHNMITDKLEQMLIQIWDVGFLDKDRSGEIIPNMCLGIAHNYGEIWDMIWCPTGCWENPSLAVLNSSTGTLPQLGLLAVACTDSCIRLYSIPHPEYLKNDFLNIYQTRPIVLQSYKRAGFSHNPGICKCISWERSNGCRFIAGGFVNGMICIWDLFTISPLLRSIRNQQTLIRPHISFFAASTNITDIAWSPYGDQLLAVTSSDRYLKIWNTKDPTWPICVFKDGLFQRVIWQLENNCLLFASDDCYINGAKHNGINLLKTGESNEIYPLNTHNGCIWSISVCGWQSMIVSGDEAGEIVAVALSQLRTYRKKNWFHFQLPVYTLHLKEFQDLKKFSPKSPLSDIETQSPVSDNSGIQEENNKESKLKNRGTYNEMMANYGIVIEETSLDDIFKITSEERKRVTESQCMNSAKINEYPLTSINKVSWNPNFGYHYWLFSAGQAGLARLTFICDSSIKSEEIIKCFSS